MTVAQIQSESHLSPIVSSFHEGLMHYGGAYSFPSRTLASLYSHCGLLVQETGFSSEQPWVGVTSQGCRQDLEGGVRVCGEG